MFYYAMSDIHGYFDVLQESMQVVDLKSNKSNKIIFLGDYIDYGKESLKVLYFIKRLSEEYDGQVIALRGNHEEIFLKKLLIANSIKIDSFKEKHKELIIWLRNLPYYFQTKRQIFVHAGILEEAGDLWMHGTPTEYFTSKYPAEEGFFYKDIIAGHVGTSELRNNKNNHEVYWDTIIYTSFRRIDNKLKEYRI